MSLAELDAIKARAEAAIPVPQEAIDAAIQRASELFIHGGYTEYERIEQALEAAAPHIASARSDIPRLVAALEAVLAMELNGDGQGYDTALERVHETVERALKEEQ